MSTLSFLLDIEAALEIRAFVTSSSFTLFLKALDATLYSIELVVKADELATLIVAASTTDGVKMLAEIEQRQGFARGPSIVEKQRLWALVKTIKKKKENKKRQVINPKKNFTNITKLRGMWNIIKT